MTITEAFGDWREFKNLEKQFKIKTIQEIIDNNEIVSLFKSFRAGTKANTKFQLEWKKEEHINELLDNISEIYAIDESSAKYKIVTNCHKDDDVVNGRIFPYCLIVIMVPRTDIGIYDAGRVDIISNINSTPSIDGGGRYFDGNYDWYDKKGRLLHSWSISNILAECGYTTSDVISDSKKRVPCILYINLLTPCHDWRSGAGKKQIDIIPYSVDIAQTVSSLAYKMPSYHGHGDDTSKHEYREKKTSLIEYLRDFLRERKKAVDNNKSLKSTDELIQSGPWYRTRPKMMEDGFKPKKSWAKTRKTFTNSIDKECKALFNLTREDLGIFAKARAMMLYNDDVYPVDHDSFQELGRKGVFILVTEKEDVAKHLNGYFMGQHVALVNTGGRFTKDVIKLIEHSESPIATLTDYDVHGIAIANDVNVPRVGIDKDIIKWLHKHGYPDLKQERIEEEYRPNMRTDDEYLRRKRIELDAILNAFPDYPGRGDEALGKYVKYKIEKLREKEGFDYNKVITIDDPSKPSIINHVISKIESYIDEITEDERNDIEKEQESIKELISTHERSYRNGCRLDKIVTEDGTMKEKIIPLFKKLSEELDKVLDEEED